MDVCSKGRECIQICIDLLSRLCPDGKKELPLNKVT